ncbi:hypothetical protein OTK49_02995 [Vibrio coralliirubri]|uniref:hypothetical protein n=1 Tax=Vibrio coralliirubri TaxID=1516159 RepID=UPI0022836E9D|nr:hypothetical protein [Vibrio coralliirubri]MCY9861482.1 hypothetical protein [Vibrio coralliirubri]
MNQQAKDHHAKEQVKRDIVQAATNISQDDNPLQVLADTLMDYFDDNGAINFIEQRFSDNDNPDRDFIVTMCLANGLTPAAKLAESEEKNTKLNAALSLSNDLILSLISTIEQLGGDRDSNLIVKALAQIDKNKILS